MTTVVYGALNVSSDNVVLDFESTGIDDNATSTAITINANGHVGIKTIPNVGWTSGSASGVVDFISRGGIHDVNGYFEIINNGYYDGTGYKRKATAEASLYQQTNAGVHQFLSAASGAADTTISWLSGLKIDQDATAGNTRLLIYDVDNAAIERVSVGAADSGGAGYKLLRIPN